MLFFQNCAPNDKNKYFLVIPLDGCESCVKKSLKFAESKVEIITEVFFTASSKKVLNFHAGNSNDLTTVNVSLDTNLLFKRYPFNQGFPILVRIRDSDSTYFKIDASTDIQSVLSEN
jgi:hypothetical protein